ncbi:MAG: hypothetical protein PHP59_02540 [Methanofollis sp.]|uniref:hypothetical protein n=1 Tax=Methanofollis sp. TaxID=2052835 RepID=UPI00260BB70D|nr:hypothetical protein [Methanofollis sp.]MDD4254236.1 hypothetical protein [Methanofollis sp.]
MSSYDLYAGKKPGEIKINPGIIAGIKTELQKVEKLLDLARTIPLTYSEEETARKLMKDYGLLPNDAEKKTGISSPIRAIT